MIQHVEPGQEPLNEGELVNALGGLLVAGHETATNFLGNGLHVLLAVPERWEALRREPATIAQTIEEILRFDTSVQTFFRTAAADTTIGEVHIPEGSLLLLVFGSANRDESKFTFPDRFDRSEEHTSELQSRQYLVCRLLLEKKKITKKMNERVATFSLGQVQRLTWRRAL